MTKKTHLSVSAFFFALGVILSYTYRPYIYQNHIFDFYIADTIGNLVASPAIINFLCVSREKKSLENNTIFTIIILIIYEVLPIGVTDIKDIISTFISCGITYLIMKIMKKE